MPGPGAGRGARRCDKTKQNKTTRHAQRRGCFTCMQCWLAGWLAGFGVTRERGRGLFTYSTVQISCVQYLPMAYVRLSVITGTVLELSTHLLRKYGVLPSNAPTAKARRSSGKHPIETVVGNT
jgi:hypothetical protein